MADLIKTITLEREVEIPLPRIPDALDAFTATEDAPDIDLSWFDNDDVATDYDIEHSLNNFSTIASSITIGSTPESGGVYTFVGLNLAITNYFRIRARNAGGASAWEVATT